MLQSYIFNGLLRRQFTILFFLGFIFTLTIASGILLLLLNGYILKLSINNYAYMWSIPIILVCFVIFVIIMVFILVKWMSHITHKTWYITLNQQDIVIYQSGQESKSFSISQLERIKIMKNKMWLGFSQAVQLIFEDEKIDIEMVISPILASSTKTDQDQFIQLTDYLYTHIIEKNFKLTNKNCSPTKISALFNNGNSIDDQYVFEQK